ncbi:MAG: lactonase family protein [Polyangiaceae bacterium]
MTRSWLGLFALLLVACSGDDDGSGGGGGSAGAAGAAGSGGGGASGSGGSGGTAGTAGSGAAGGDAGTDAAVNTVTYVYVGSSKGGADNIDRFTLDPTSGKLTALGRTTSGGTADFMALHPSQDLLYVADTQNDEARAFSLDRATGALSAMGSVGLSGAPVYLTVDKTGKHLLVAHYNQGKADVVALGANGALGALTDTQSPGSKSHCIVLDPSGSYVFVPNNGSNTISQYVYDDGAGKLTANAPGSVATSDGPRHMDFHPSKPFAYVMNEQGTSMTAYAFDAAKGTLTEIETEESLPASVTAPSTGADVHVHPNGKFVYGSNRSQDQSTLVIFSIDPSTGALTLVGHEGTRGSHPRNFEIDPSGRVLLVTNRDSSNVVSFLIDETTGKLSFVEEVPVVDAPFFVGAYRFPSP